MATTDTRVDEQIASAPAFAQPVMLHLRALVHEACPEVEETIKWRRPFFLYRGRMVCAIAAFKQHCSFGFIGPEMAAVMREAGMPEDDSAGSLGRLRSLGDLPDDEQMRAWIRQAAGLAGSGAPRKRTAAKKPELETPADLAVALKAKKGAAAIFDGFSASCRREYAEWITEAKRAETRERRVAQAVEWIAEGKTRNWKYQNC